MLSLADVLELPRGVRHVPGAVVDDVCSVSHPTNPAADEILAATPTTVGEAAERLASRFGISRSAAAEDALRFAWQMNAAGLVNVRRGLTRMGRVASWAGNAIHLLPLGRLPSTPVRRLPLDSSTRVRAVRGTVQALLPRATAIALSGGALLALAGAMAGAVALDVVVGAGLMLGAALLVHESAHVVALAPAPAALVLAGLRTSVVHAALPRSRAAVVAASGPLAAGSLGVAVGAWALHDASFAGLLAACPPTGHLLGLTVATVDGRVACGVEAS